MVCYPTVDNGYNFPQKMKPLENIEYDYTKPQKEGKKMENKTTS